MGRRQLKTHGLLFACTVLSGCVWLGDARTVPHASIKLGIPEGQTLDQAVALLDRTVLRLGYNKQQNDWEKWKPILSEAELELKKKEATYTSDGMRIMYMPERNAEYLASDPQAPLARRPSFFLHFYEDEGYVFTDRGIAAHEALKAALAAEGLQSLEADDIDRKHYRPVSTPVEFNQQHGPPSFQRRAVNVGYAVYAFAAYALLIAWPAWWLGLRALRKRTMSLIRKRLLFTALGSLLLPPVAVPMSMFGPVLLIPLPLAAPLLPELPPRYLLTVAISTALTAVCCFLVSMKIQSTAAQQGAPADPPRPAGSAGG